MPVQYQNRYPDDFSRKENYLDLLSYLAASPIKAVCMNAMGPNPEVNTDNASILLRFANGSNGVVNYFANGEKMRS